MLIYGIHACKAALTSNKNIIKVYWTNKKPMPEWLEKFPKHKVCLIDDIQFKKMLPDEAVYQGVAIEVEDVHYEDISILKDAPKNCAVAILDNVTDPHNLGAIIRTAAAFRISGIIIPEKSSCKVTSITAKSASGGLEHVDIFVVKNLSQTIETLKTYGFWIVSFCERGDKFIHEIDLRGKTCLIFGAEGDGIRRLQKERSDFVVKLPTNPNFPTLNVSVSAAVAFYETARQNKFCLD